MKTETEWKLVFACHKCLSLNTSSGLYKYCKDCGGSGAGPVLMQEVQTRKFFRTQTERRFKRYWDYVNPFEAKEV